ncbi:MAG: hypothetical protein AAGM45_15420 [Cyanobacteria bacterium J06588_5]
MSVIADIQSGVKPVDGRFIADSRELEITFNTGSKYRWPVDALEMKEQTSEGWQLIPRPENQQLESIEIWNNGEVVEFVDIEQCFSIPGLMRGHLGSKKWMQALLKEEKLPTSA